MDFREVLRLPTGTLISGTITIPCQHSGCEETFKINIDDIDKEGEGGEIDGIDYQCEETQYRCPECRERYLTDCARDSWKYDL